MRYNILDDFNNRLFAQWQNLPNINNLACPYLITPTREFCNAKIKVGVFNRETNGWGDSETKQNLIKTADDLKKIYTTNVNENWENLGSIWPMYYALRELSEGSNPEPQLRDKVGFIHSNVALIGQKYGNYGFDASIESLLADAIDKQLQLLDLDIILLGIGFGVQGHTEEPYLKLLNQTSYLGKLEATEPVAGCPNLYKLSFRNCRNKEIYGYPHPQGLSYRPIVQKVREIIYSKL